jgi:hypothetical protein
MASQPSLRPCASRPLMSDCESQVAVGVDHLDRSAFGRRPVSQGAGSAALMGLEQPRQPAFAKMGELCCIEQHLVQFGRVLFREFLDRRSNVMPPRKGLASKPSQAPPFPLERNPALRASPRQPAGFVSSVPRQHAARISFAPVKSDISRMVVARLEIFFSIF